AHKVYLAPFYIDKFEVTNEQFDQFVKQSRYRPEAKVSWERYARPGMERHPVRGVTWKDATEYAKWAGKRLPTEAEWEKAARGTLGQRYPWGNDYDRAKFHGNAELDAGPAPVGSYPEGRSPYGCEDMAGNVWEWCADWHAADYYAKSPKENPTGPSSWGRKKEKVIRGGAWDRQSIEHIKCYERAQFNPSASMETIGFRCVKDVPE
ncbi:MAG: formylglycine-generating enzyme family protein, partial [Planctomycetes bacterium]|nr:formylglycine-generating enzyme family protein [Planctomycetota bacterium]